MNYSKDSRRKQQELSNKNKKTKKKNKVKLIVLRVILIGIIIGSFAGVGAGWGLVAGILKQAPDVAGLELKPTTGYTSFIYDKEGMEMDRLSSGENRIYVELEEIPLYLQQAVIAIEDERFYEHNGIDLKGIIRAVMVNLTSGDFSEGASTITQQLIKNNVLTSEKKLTRKIQEQYLAVQIEKVYAEEYGEKEAKDLILEYYLNTMPLGRGTNGVQAAAHRYFNKDVSSLTLAESVVLACITQAPTRFDPISNPENNYEKSERILTKMIEQEYISEKDKEIALAENPYKGIQEVNQKYTTKSTHSYFVDAVIETVLKDLQEEKGMTAVQANNLLFGGGVEIYTTFDPKIQRSVDKYTSDESLYPKGAYELKLAYSATVRKANGTTANLYGEGIVRNESEIEQFKQAKHKAWGLTEADKIEAEYLFKIPQPQSAFVIMDHTTGQVKALSGGRGDKEGDRTFNRATQAKRQPGSIFKVLSTYAPALDRGVLGPGSILMDEPLTIELPTGPYSPNNWDLKNIGPVTVRQAIWHSINTVAVKTLDEVGIDTAYKYLQKFGFTTLLESDKVYALALGGLSEGVTPIELNAAMATIANGGTYIEPVLYTKIVDRDGNVIFEKKPKSHRVVSEATASMMTDMMEDVIKIGTGKSLSTSFSGMPVAGKTGTTNDDKDFSFAAFTPYYTATIWLGHDQPKRVVATGREHIKIWGSIMNEVHKELPHKVFEKVTTGYEKISVCKLSGKIPTELCSLDSVHQVVTDYFPKGKIPKEFCDEHKKSVVEEKSEDEKEIEEKSEDEKEIEEKSEDEKEIEENEPAIEAPEEVIEPPTTNEEDGFFVPQE